MHLTFLISISIEEHIGLNWWNWCLIRQEDNLRNVLDAPGPARQPMAVEEHPLHPPLGQAPAFQVNYLPPLSRSRVAKSFCWPLATCGDYISPSTSGPSTHSSGQESSAPKEFNTSLLIQNDLPRPLVWQLWQRHRGTFLCSGLCLSCPTPPYFISCE